MKNIELFKNIMSDVQEYVLKNESPYNILEGYEYIREVITLYAKQHNLVESTLLLLENNNNEEAMILARSVLNNYFLIGYLLNDPDKSHLKEYQSQPLFSQLYYWKNVKEMLNGQFGQDLRNDVKQFTFTAEDVDNNIALFEQEIINKGFQTNKRPLRIIDLAKYADNRSFELYSTFYAYASKYEHSDISTLDIYKQKIFDNHSNNEVFTLDMNRTDDKLKETALTIIITAYTQSLYKLINELTVKQSHLKSQFDEEKLKLLMSKVIHFINA